MQPEQSVEEIKRLQRCISDLVSVLALPAIWSGGNPSQVVRILLDVLQRMLRLDLIYVRLNDPFGGEPVEMVRVAQTQNQDIRPQDTIEAIKQHLGPDPRKCPPLMRHPAGDGDISILPLRLGLQSEIGMILAGAQRADFPEQTESLLLNVAANQASIGLQEAQLLSNQKRLANELDQRVAERTKELAVANEALLKEIAGRKLVEERLRREEKELKVSEARKAAILDSALDSIVTIDHRGLITEFNPAAEHTFGYRREQVLGKPLADTIIPPLLRETHREGFARYLATGEARVLGRRLEMTAIRADGSEFPVELAITPIPTGGLPSFTGFLRDITKRKRAEQELRRSEAFLAEGQRLSSTGSFSWRVDTDVITCSAELYRIYQIPPGTPVTFELIGTRVHPDDIPSLNDMIDWARSAGSNFEHDHRLQVPDGTVKYLHMVAHATRDEDHRLEYIGAIQDVTQRRLSDEALGKARAELAHVARVTTLGALTASIAHEVNQPLSGIITNANTGLRMLGASPPDVVGALETVRRTLRDGNRAADVIARLRALFSKKSFTRELVDLNEATREVIALSLIEFQRSRVVVRTELADGLPPVTGDRVQLQQVILNLCLNASDAMSGIDDRPRQLLIRTERLEDDRVCVSVQDAGIGIEPKNAEVLFDAFYTTKTTGMGIGLSVSRSIIEGHHGRLWASSNDGPGATFSFSIPRGTDTVTDVHSLGASRTSTAPEAKHH
ncbi:MAG: PAS domain S-box protein [Steroidobacteraceae bacterium]